MTDKELLSAMSELMDRKLNVFGEVLTKSSVLWRKTLIRNKDIIA